MAYVPDATDPNATAQAPANAQAAPQTSTGGGVGGSAAPGGTAPVAQASPTAGNTPPVQDLHAYLSANQPQAVQMGKNIAGNLDQTYQGAVGDINSSQQAVDQTVKGQTVTPDSGLVSKAAANPTEFAKDPNNVAAFQSQRDATYKGPTAFETTPEYQKAQQSVSSARQKAPDISQSQGVEQLARSQETNPTTGMSNLDALLLQGTPEAMTPVKSSVGQFANLGTHLSDVAGQENAAIQQAQGNATKASQGVKDAFLTGPNAVVPTFRSGVNKELQTDIGQVNAYNKALGDLITQENAANPQLTGLTNSVNAYNDALKSDAGGPADIQSRVAGSNPLDLGAIQNPASLAQPTLAQAATSADISEQQALEILLGSGFSPSFDATGQIPFKSPGENPTLKSLLAPILAKLAPQLSGVNPNVFSYDPTGKVGVQPTQNYDQNIKDSLTALQAYLGESGGAPLPITGPPTPGPFAGPGNAELKNPLGGTTAYVDPNTGQTKYAY